MAKAGGAYGNAQQDIDAQRRALLSAVAQRGDQGLAEMEAQNKAAQAMRQQAVQGVAQQAGAYGRPELTSQLQGAVGQTADAFSADAAAGARGLGGAMQGISQLNDNYMRQVGAAVPVAEAVSDMNVQKIKGEAEEAARVRAAELEQARLSVQETRLRIANEQRDKDKAAKDAENPVKDVNYVSSVTGFKPEEQIAMQANQGYGSLADALARAQDMGANSAQAWSMLQATNKELDKTYGHGFGRTMDLVWAQLGHQFPGYDEGELKTRMMERAGADAGRRPAAPRRPGRPTPPPDPRLNRPFGNDSWGPRLPDLPEWLTRPRWGGWGG